jgi:hypothetical protein
VTKIGYYLLNRYQVSYVVVIIVLFLDIANLVSGVVYGVVESNRFGF